MTGLDGVKIGEPAVGVEAADRVAVVVDEAFLGQRCVDRDPAAVEVDSPQPLDSAFDLLAVDSAAFDAVVPAPCKPASEVGFQAKPGKDFSFAARYPRKLDLRDHHLWGWRSKFDRTCPGGNPGGNPIYPREDLGASRVAIERPLEADDADLDGDPVGSSRDGWAATVAITETGAWAARLRSHADLTGGLICGQHSPQLALAVGRRLNNRLSLAKDCRRPPGLHVDQTPTGDRNRRSRCEQQGVGRSCEGQRRCRDRCG